MINVDFSIILENINDFCRHGLEEAASLCISQQGLEVEVSHFLFKMLDNPFSDVRLLLKQSQVDHELFKQSLAEGFAHNGGSLGNVPAFSPLLTEAFQEAWTLGSLELSQTEIRSGTIFLAVLLHSARYLPLRSIQLLEKINRETLRKNFVNFLLDSGESVSSETANSENKQATISDAETPLSQFGHNFTQQAKDNKIDPVLSRDEEISLMIDILLRRRKNNPIAVGDAGVGKSALVEGLALRIAAGKVPDSLKNVELWGLDVGALQAGASVKGEFEKRLKAVIDQVKNSTTPIILFIDEAHTLIGAGGQAGGSDAANLLKPALARGELRTIAATTWSEYKKYFEKDPALSRRFQLVKLVEPTVAQATNILRGLRTIYEKAHQVYITGEALEAAAALSSRYVSGRQLPDKAIDVLDTACARVASGLQSPPKQLTSLENKAQEIQMELDNIKRDQEIGTTIEQDRLTLLLDQLEALESNVEDITSAWKEQQKWVKSIIETRESLLEESDEVKKSVLIAELQAAKQQLISLQTDYKLLHAEVGKEQIANVIADLTGIPVSTISGDDLDKITTLPERLFAELKGQDHAINTIHRHLLTATADLRRQGTPIGAFLLVGPSGVGKTETAVQIANKLFGGKQFLTTINMSEYQEKHSLSRLIGSPPGYVGYGEGGLLTEAIRQKPYSIVLLDEVEKAHPEVLNLFYQAFDKGEIADGEGRIIDCKNILFFLTSNIGFDQDSDNVEAPSSDVLRSQLLQFFKPALLARMQVIQYHYLGEEVLEEIVHNRVNKLIDIFGTRHKTVLDVSADVIEKLKSHCHKNTNGARLLDAIIDGDVLPPLSLAVLKNMASETPITSARLYVDEGEFAAELV